MSGIDFTTILPLEMTEIIFSQLDVDTLINCTMVCKNWHSVISANYHLWKFACGNLGLQMETVQIPEENDMEYKRICLKMRNRFQKMQAGGEVFELCTVEASQASCLCYHNGIVAVGMRFEIELWKLNPEPKWHLGIDNGRRDEISCIHFDDFFLAVGTITDGEVSVYKLPTGELLYTYLPRPPGMLSTRSVIFNKDIDLLVSSSYNYVEFCCLSSGQFLTRCQIDNHVLDIKLFYNPELPNGCNYVLLCIRVDSFCEFIFDSNRVSFTLKRTYDYYFEGEEEEDEDEEHSDIENELASGYVVDSYLYHMHISSDVQQTTFLKCHFPSGNDEHIFDMKGVCLQLLGVGRKYACMLKGEHGKPGEPGKYVAIFDLCTRTEVATLLIPQFKLASCIYFPVLACLGDKNWLDGFNGFNDKGVFLVYKGIDCEKSITIVKWLA